MATDGAAAAGTLAGQLARAVMQTIKGQQVPRVVWGTVSEVSGQVCHFTPQGSSTALVGIRALRPYTPTNGDTARGEFVGTDLYLTGAR